MSNLKPDERVSIELRGLYQQYGYLPYKVSKFEEYDLYMRNKSFLASEHVLSFSDMDGKLMALKPDITLSIIKNSPDACETLKVSYAETVYRVPRGAYGFKEIMQAGLEYIGEVDAYAMSEVLMLAGKSLAAISDRWALDIADLRVISGILENEAIGESERAQLLALIGDKNLHGLSDLCVSMKLSEKTGWYLAQLVTVFGPLEETLTVYEAMALPESCGPALRDLRAMCEAMKLYGLEHINLDFSVVNDMNYYNGLIFAGFIDGAASGVLSGGRYDHLMRRMGKRSSAIGFAVYLDQLERLMDERPAFDVDTLITYDDRVTIAEVVAAAQREVSAGKRVRVQRAGDAAVRCRSQIDLSGMEVRG